MDTNDWIASFSPRECWQKSATQKSTTKEVSTSKIIWKQQVTKLMQHCQHLFESWSCCTAQVKARTTMYRTMNNDVQDYEQCTVLCRKGIQIQVSSSVDVMSVDNRQALFLPHGSLSLVERFSFALGGRVSQCSLLDVGWPISVLDGFKNTEFERVNSSEATKLTNICSEPHETIVVQERIHIEWTHFTKTMQPCCGWFHLPPLNPNWALKFASWAHHSGEERYQEYLMPQRNLPWLCGFLRNYFQM